MPNELFRSTNLLVRHVPAPGAGRGCCVVTFDSFTDHPTLDRTGFAQNLLHDAGIDAIHVLSRTNDWYQYPETPAALAPIQPITARYPRVVAYGSSMGAYAALRLAGTVGANTVLALSPQFSIARHSAPWERRWPFHTQHFQDIWETSLPWPAPHPAYVLFDPRDRDRRHTARLAAAMPITPVPLPRCGHPVTGVLAEMGLLRPALLDVCAGTFDPAALIAQAAARHPRSAHALIAQAERLPWWQPRRRLTLLQKAQTLAPNDPAVLSRLAAALRRQRRYPEALALHHQVHAAAPQNPAFLFSHALTLAATNDRAGALALAAEITALAGPQNPYAARLQARLRIPAWRTLAPAHALLKKRTPPPGT